MDIDQLEKALYESVLKVIKEGREVVAKDDTLKVTATSQDWGFALKLVEKARSATGGSQFENDLADMAKAREKYEHKLKLSASNG